MPQIVVKMAKEWKVSRAKVELLGQFFIDELTSLSRRMRGLEEALASLARTSPRSPPFSSPPSRKLSTNGSPTMPLLLLARCDSSLCSNLIGAQ